MPSSPPGYQDDDEPFLVGHPEQKLRFWLLLGEGGGGGKYTENYSQRKLNTHILGGGSNRWLREGIRWQKHSFFGTWESMFFEVPLKGLFLCFLNCTSSYLGSSMYSQKSNSLEIWKSTPITTQQIRSKWILACIAGSKPILRINFSDPKNNPFRTYCWITPAFLGSTNSQLSKPNTPTPLKFNMDNYPKCLKEDTYSKSSCLISMWNFRGVYTPQGKKASTNTAISILARKTQQHSFGTSSSESWWKINHH